jgi:tight adherence protein B
VTGALIGLLAGIGVVLIWVAITPTPRLHQHFPRPTRGLTRLVERAAIPRVTVGAVLGACCAAGLITGTIVLIITALPIAAVLAAIGAGAVPILLLKRTIAQRVKALRVSWPDAVDALVSGVRAGMSLPEALTDLARRGPEPLRPAFTVFATEYRATGSLFTALDVLQDTVADPVADRVIASLRIAREVGGTDLGMVLRTLSALLRLDARTRGEIESRQSWTLSAARMAVAAPWVTLALLATRPEGNAAYRTATGALVIAFAAVATFLAYRIMRAIGRLPVEVRMGP